MILVFKFIEISVNIPNELKKNCILIYFKKKLKFF